TYGRVSTHEQSITGTSLDGQGEQFNEYSKQAGPLERIDFVEGESGSGKGEERRVEVARMISMVRPGGVVVVTKFDRFTRNLSFAIEKVREIIQRGGRFVSLAEGEFDRTPESEFKLAIWAGVAQMEHARIQDRTRTERRRLRAQGKFVEGQP